MRNILPALFLVFCLAFPLPAFADDFYDEDFMEINLSIGFQSHNIKDMAYDYYSGEDWFANSYLAAEVEVWDELFVSLAIGTGEANARLFDEWATTLSLTEPQLAVRYGYPLFDWIRPYALAGLVYTVADTTIDLWYPHSVGMNNGWKDGTWGGRLALGSEVFLSRNVFGVHRSGLFKDFTMGIGVEGGYMLKQSIDLLVHQGKNGDLSKKPPMGVVNIDLGDLDLSGFYMAVDFRFYF